LLEAVAFEQTPNYWEVPEMAFEKHQFVATGPREQADQGAPEPAFTAFASGWTDPAFDYGVNVEAGHCGVFGSSLRGGPRVIDQSIDIQPGVGVCGLGDQHGVYGQTRELDGVGVRGTSYAAPGKGKPARSLGVLGEGGSAGVVGKASPPEHGQSIDLPAGVVGLVAYRPAHDSSHPHALLEKTQLPRDVVPNGGAGVVGAGVVGRGLVGYSEYAAQLHLHPSKELSDPPRDGSAGDLLVILDRPEDRGQLDRPLASLWFCIQDSDKDKAACWRRIAFDQQRGECDFDL
jgi:hypothetical protein